MYSDRLYNHLKINSDGYYKYHDNKENSIQSEMLAS